MQSIFGNNWTKQFRNETQAELAFREWSSEIEKLSVDELKVGFNALIESGAEWPPSLPHFIALCKRQQSGLRHNTAAYREFRKEKLLTNKTKKEDAVKHIQSLRELLK